jgi:radical SAM superfamily enzyme YgiQ (UPF0313 family)
MVGFPEETEETLYDTIKAIKKINSDQIVYSIFTPYPGTEAFQFCEENGLIEDFKLSLFNHQSPVNHFCMNIEPKKFRKLLSKIEKLVERKNKINSIKQILFFNKIWRVKELGITETFRSLIRIMKN